MADDLVPDWRVQASFKFGPADGYGVGRHMLNVRADDFDELGQLLESVPGSLADKLANASTALGIVQTVADATGGNVTVESHSDAPASSGAPRCAHGERTYFKSPKGWEAFFCPQPKNAKSKCDPIFKGDDNESEPYWP